MGKSTISMAIFNSYFDITRGYVYHQPVCFTSTELSFGGPVFSIDASHRHTVFRGTLSDAHLDSLLMAGELGWVAGCGIINELLFLFHVGEFQWNSTRYGFCLLHEYYSSTYHTLWLCQNSY